jgi:hypothetical protein
MLNLRNIIINNIRFFDVDESAPKNRLIDWFADYCIKFICTVIYVRMGVHTVPVVSTVTTIRVVSLSLLWYFLHAFRLVITPYPYY